MSEQEPVSEQSVPRGVAAVFGPTINAIVGPESAFRAIDARPVLAVWPLVWTIVAMMGLGMWNLDFTRQMMRVGMVEGMMNQGQTPDPEQLSETLEMMDRFAPVWAIGGNLFIIILVAVMAVGIWIGSSLLGGRTNFGRSLGVASVAGVIHPLLATTFVTVMWKIDPPQIRRIRDMFEVMPSLGLDMFFKGSEMSLFLRTLFARVDLFNVWWIVVVSIGGRVLLGLKKGQAIGLAIAIWALSSLVSAFWASLSG